MDVTNCNLSDIFGANVFNDSVMKTRLPKATYKLLRKTIDEGNSLDASIAEIVANAMKDWAIEKGAVHYSHWFQPMTGVTAEKHESFISPTPDGKAIMEFSGKELIKGEPDASSFPSGGLRATFEARGYTAWDCTSPAFVKNCTLYIPTAFCSYTGEVLDKKTPLLRSMEAISTQAMRILKLFGNSTIKRVVTTVGAEQEYFLIDKQLFNKRKDLMFTGRTLFGAKPPKGQEMDDHYFGVLKERVYEFMKDLDKELWKLGISSKTKHNEVAPSQHELATIFTTTNIATDQNQLIMEMMKKIANKHGLACLLHEKPFSYVNGSGKHNNWSISTDDGQNLLEPGDTPCDNAQFLIFLCAVIKAVDEYSDLLRLSATNPGNDHRLGANEAPPAIISIFLGNQLTDILEQIEVGVKKSANIEPELKIGVSTLPPLPKDSTDRNRTSPFAFTGNKFEFRMTPSSASIATPNFILNTIVAQALSEIADNLEKSTNLKEDIQSLIRNIMIKHKKIIFNGNNYSQDWIVESQKRGLPNISSTVDAIKTFSKEKNIKIFEAHNVLRRSEVESRSEILFEEYIKTINIEALTMLDIAKRQILPSCINYSKFVAESINEIKNTGIAVDISAQSDLLKNISSKLTLLSKSITSLEESVKSASELDESNYDKACFYRDTVLVKMAELRKYADKLETIVGKDFWPMPTYSDLLFY